MNTQLIKLTQDALFKTQQQIEELDLQLKAIYEKEKTDKDNWRKYWDEKNNIREELKQLKELERHQQNQVNCLENEGELTTIVDKKGQKHENIPDFRQTDTEQIQFEIDEILTAKLPPYIPVIDEEKFRSKGYVFDAIRIDKDSYILSTKEHEEDKPTYYVIVTLDQLVLTQDYYYTKAKAAAIKDAQESDIRQEKYWDSLPEERRQRFLNQQDLYHSLPVKIKKTITQADYESLTWQEKEKIYKFFKRSRPKKLKSQLSSTTMWGSYHRMYERFVNPEAVMPKPRYANKEVWEYWVVFRDMMEYKMKDIAIQRAELSEIRQKAIETSFGEINTSLVLKKQYGVLVKRQNGDKINLMEIEQIKDALVSVQKIFGSIKQIAEKTNLKISHTGTRYVFASKAAGMYVPSMGTIAVSDKFGDHQFKMTMAHEIAHFIDNYIGRLNEKRYLTDDYESTAGKVAFTFRKYLNGNKATLSDYTKSTKECFARALEMYYGIETIGENAGVLYSDEPLNDYQTFFIAKDFVNKENYTNHVKPLIEQFFKEQKDVLIYGEDIDESNNPISVGKEVGGETFAEVESNLHKLIEVATTKEDKQQINEAIKVMELMQALEKKEIEKTVSRLEYFNLKKPLTITDVEKQVDYILSQYSGRDMAYIQVRDYLSEINDNKLGSQFLQKHNIKNPEELEKYLKSRQSKVRKPIVEEIKKASKEYEDIKAQVHLENIMNMALEQGAKMDKEIEEYDKSQKPKLEKDIRPHTSNKPKDYKEGLLLLLLPGEIDWVKIPPELKEELDEYLHNIDYELEYYFKDKENAARDKKLTDLYYDNKNNINFLIEANKLGYLDYLDSHSQEWYDFKSDYLTFSVIEDVLAEIKEKYPTAIKTQDPDQIRLFKKGGQVRRYNLPINENYKLIDSFYTGGLDNATICDNCDRPIANVATIKNSKEEVFNVGLDCAETLTHLDGLYSAKMDFEELKSIQAKIRKQEKDGKNLEYEIYNNGDLLIKSDGFTIIDKDIDFAKKYMPNYLQKVKNPEKIGFEYKEKEINIPFERFLPRENKDFVKKWKVDEYDIKVSVEPYFHMVTKEISGYDFYLDVQKNNENIYSKRVTTYRDIPFYINYAIRDYLFDKYDNNAQKPENIGQSDLKKRLEIVKKMAQKNPELKSRVKIIEKMIQTPKLEKGGQVDLMIKTNYPVIDEVLIKAQPIIEKQTANFIKRETEDNKKPTKFAIENYQLGLIYDLVKALSKYVDKTDEIKNIDLLINRGVLTINCNILRKNQNYYLSTQIIHAGGHNVQRLHLRYIVDTNLPPISTNTSPNIIKEKIKNLTKIEKIKQEITNFNNRISYNTNKINEHINWTDDEIIEELKKSDTNLTTTWDDILKRGADKNYKNKTEFDIKKKEYLQSKIKFWKNINIESPKRNNLALLEQIKKLNKKLTELEKPKLEKGGEIYNENLSYLLNPTNTIDFIGEEKGKYIEDGISLYKNKYGSYRYVYSENGTPIAALQVMSMDGKNGVVANAYTVPSKRKKGFGRKLFNHAKKKFKEIKHSEHLSGSGKLFADNVLEKGGQVPNNFIHPKYNDEEYRKAMDIFDVPVDFLWQYREFDRCGKDNIYGDKYIKQFTNYIKENGITKPIILTVDTGKGLITDGNHRLCIAKKLGFKTVPVEVVHGKFGDINKHRSKPINFRKERWYFGFWD